MSKVETAVAAITVFVFTGAAAYLIESFIFRKRGTIGRYESLFEYYKKVDQKQGNFAAVAWALIWIVLMVLAALIIYLVV